MKKQILIYVMLLFTSYVFSNDFYYVEKYTPFARNSSYFEEFKFYDDGLIKQINRYGIEDGIDYYNWNKEKDKLLLLDSFFIERTELTLTEYQLKGGNKEVIRKFEKKSSDIWMRTEIRNNEERTELLDFTDHKKADVVIQKTHLAFGMEECYLLDNTLYRMFDVSGKMEYKVSFDNKNIYVIKTDYPYGEECSITCFMSEYIPFSKEAAYLNFYLISSSNAFDTVFFSVPTIAKRDSYYSEQGKSINYSEKTISYNNQIMDFMREEDIYGMKFYYDKANNKYLFLKCEDLLLVYDKDNAKPFFCGFSDNKQRKEIYNITASSFLKEKSISYVPENLINLKLKEPWVEGVNGNGEGECLIINPGYASGMYIINGFVSLNRPDLYEKNNRVEQIEMEGTISGRKEKILLLDSAKPQFFDLSGFSKGEDIKITIKSVYKGSMYEDTCLSGLLFVN